jgi:hypothetical protein
VVFAVLLLCIHNFIQIEESLVAADSKVGTSCNVFDIESVPVQIGLLFGTNCFADRQSPLLDHRLHSQTIAKHAESVARAKEILINISYPNNGASRKCQRIAVRP